LQWNSRYAHSGSGFLWWHRKFILEFEQAVRALGGQFKCFALPYWNWAIDAQACVNDPNCIDVWKHSSTYRDMGGGGDPNCAAKPYSLPTDADYLPGKAANMWAVDCDSQVDPEHCRGGPMQALYGRIGGCGAMITSGVAFHDFRPRCDNVSSDRVGCITTGPFAGWTFGKQWPEVRDIEDAVTNSSFCVSRRVYSPVNRTLLKMISTAWLVKVITGHKNYGFDSGFRATFEQSAHDLFHYYIGGNFDTFASVYDPLFMLHHSFVDKIFAAWQNCHGFDDVRFEDARGVSYLNGTYTSPQYAASQWHDRVRFIADGCHAAVHTEPGRRACPGGTNSSASDDLCASGYGIVDDRFEAPIPFGYPDMIDRCPVLGSHQLSENNSECYACVLNNYAADCRVRSPADGRGHVWDMRCEYFCGYPHCAEACGTTLLRAPRNRPADFIPTWDQSTETIAALHNTHMLGYKYTTDGLDEAIRDNVAGKCPTDGCNTNA